MRISSKSILSPGRAGVRDPPNSLPTSLSRRLRNSGSIKGGASPAMFPTAKKRGAFDNPEPSSPKVTCIGQVRVRGKKKQAKKLRSLSRRHSSGDVSFKKLEHPLHGFPSKRHNHQESLNLGLKCGQNQAQNQDSCTLPVQRSWVHFPVTICEALKAFGSEFSCLIPCRTERGKVEKSLGGGDGGRPDSCGAVFTRWLVAVQDGDGGGERDIELVIGDEEESVVRRRHVFEDLEIIDGRIEGHKDEARVSICIPPKNALLLMRCRSDPVKVEALANRSWEPSVARNDEEDEEVVDCENHIDQEIVEQQQVLILDQNPYFLQQDEGNHDQVLDNVQENEVGQDQEIDNVQKVEVGQAQELDNVLKDEVGQDQEHQEHDNVQKDEVGQDQEHQEHNNMEQYEVGQDQEHEQAKLEEESFNLASLFEETMNQDLEIQELEAHEEDKVAEIEANDSTMVTEFAQISKIHEAKMVNNAEESEEQLPECLLMMMHEPKLSLNVSKETWVCSKDFIKRPSNRRKPPPPPAPVDGGDGSSGGGGATVNEVKMVAGGGFPAVLQQPARSSCSLPAAPSMAAALEQKLADAVGYEPFVLTRCKSEPMKTAAAKLLPESCVWENRKLERLSGVRFGVGAAGLGF